MKTEEQIKQKIEQLFQKRLDQRKEKYLGKHYRNCLYNFSKEIDGIEHFFCANVENPEVKSEIIFLCENSETCQKCNNYVCKHTEESVKLEMMNDISDPSVCGVKEPKLAVLLWVLRDENNEEAKKEIKEEKKNSAFGFLKQIFFRGE